MTLSSIAAYADSGGIGGGGGNPACVVTSDTVPKACSFVEDENCPDDFIEDGDCPSTEFSTSGLNSVDNFQVDCKYYKSVPGENGCETDGVLRTYHAACSQADGESCPQAGQ